MTFNDSYGDIGYYVGDGHDTVEGADERSILKLGKGLTFEDTSFAMNGDDLTVSFGEAGGSVTFKDYQTKGLPLIEFNDGRMLDASSTIAYAGGGSGRLCRQRQGGRRHHLTIHLSMK